MRQRNGLLFVLVLLIVVSSGCPSSGEYCKDARCGDIFGDYIDPAITTIGGALDDQIGASFTADAMTKDSHLWQIKDNSFLETEVLAAACFRPGAAVCLSESKTAEYSGCAIDETPFSLTGVVRLEYSGTQNCGFASIGDTVTRTMSLSRTLPDNGVLTISSEDTTDHRGIAVGGGTKLTVREPDSYELDVMGVHKVLHKDDVKTYDLLFRTTAPVSITGDLGREGRIINGGVIELITSNFVSSLVPESLQYSAACCYPVAGSMRYNSTGARNESGTIIFSECGVATVARDGDSSPYTVSLVSCE
jgi:hypothetical protein